MTKKLICEVLNFCKEDLNDLLKSCCLKYHKNHSILILDNQCN